MELITLITYFLVLLLLFALIALAIMYQWSLIGGRAPFISMPNKTLDEIVAALKLQPDSVLYDLGCGDGRILIAAQKRNPHTRSIGVDKNSLPAFLARHAVRKQGKAGEIKIRHENFFKTDLSEATHIYCYLFPKVMDDLLPKFERELKPGTRLVSCAFQFHTKEPVEIIYFKAKNRLVEKMFVYEF